MRTNKIVFCAILSLAFFVNSGLCEEKGKASIDDNEQEAAENNNPQYEIIRGVVTKIDFQKSEMTIKDSKDNKRVVILPKDRIGNFAEGDRVRVRVNAGDNIVLSIRKTTKPHHHDTP